ncbi:hypothetical protein [Streptomyces sp. TE5632]
MPKGVSAAGPRISVRFRPHRVNRPAALPRFLTVRLDLADLPFVLEGDHFETGHLWFLVLPLAAVNALLGREEGFAGWNRWAYLLFLLYGFALGDDERVRALTRRVAALAGVLGLLLFAATAPGFVAGDAPFAAWTPFTAWTPFALFTRAALGAAGWCWVPALPGLLDRPRNGTSGAPEATAGAGAGRDCPLRGRLHGARRYGRYPVLAALPLYVLHQPVVVAFAYGVVGWSAPMAVQYVVIVAASLAVILAVYAYRVRGTRLTRFLFGVRPQPRPRPTTAPTRPGPTRSLAS